MSVLFVAYFLHPSRPPAVKRLLNRMCVIAVVGVAPASVALSAGTDHIAGTNFVLLAFHSVPSHSPRDNERLPHGCQVPRGVRARSNVTSATHACRIGPHNHGSIRPVPVNIFFPTLWRKAVFHSIEFHDERSK